MDTNTFNIECTVYWTTRGAQVSDRPSQEREVLAEVTRRWGNHQVLHVWDRGFAGNPWLTMAFVHGVLFVLRWPKFYKSILAPGCCVTGITVPESGA